MPLVMALDAALEALPAMPGIYWRGVDTQAMPEPLQARWLDAHRTGRVTQQSGYTSLSKVEGLQYGGDWQMQLLALTARDLELFSLNGEPEVILPRRAKMKAERFESGYRDFTEVDGVDVKKARQFTDDDKLKMESLPPEAYTDEDLLKRAEYMAAHGWPSVEFALDMIKKGREMAKIARAKQDEFDRSATPEQKARAKAFLDRCMLQYLA
ncbi:MAG: hypothetical protein PHI49_04505 [Halothiobacillaceae bacterium]|nr:hypothetical protein [Halothiobacillaceae bacterium]